METFSERDLFELSKAFPGAYTPRVAFANNTITGPVATVRTGFSQSTAANFNKAGVPMEPMGTEDYLVIMYCPYLSQFFMATTETSSVAGSQLSGLFM